MKVIFVHYFGGLDRFSHSFVFVAHFVFLRDVWIQTERAAVARKCATNLATHFAHLRGTLTLMYNFYAFQLLFAIIIETKNTIQLLYIKNYNI